MSPHVNNYRQENRQSSAELWKLTNTHKPQGGPSLHSYLGRIYRDGNYTTVLQFYSSNANKSDLVNKGREREMPEKKNKLL